jgi:CheY-like chemotaxis protein
MRLLLVVDSSASFVFSMAVLLRNLQYKVKTATSAESALQIMTETPPTLVNFIKDLITKDLGSDARH